MKKNLVFVIVCMVLLITKYVISGGYYDFTLQQNELQSMQSTLIDDNKRAIAKLENYRSPSYLFSQKESLGLQEINPKQTIILIEGIANNTNSTKSNVSTIPSSPPSNNSQNNNHIPQPSITQTISEESLATKPNRDNEEYVIPNLE